MVFQIRLRLIQFLLKRHGFSAVFPEKVRIGKHGFNFGNPALCTCNNAFQRFHFARFLE